MKTFKKVFKTSLGSFIPSVMKDLKGLNRDFKKIFVWKGGAICFYLKPKEKIFNGNTSESDVCPNGPMSESRGESRRADCCCFALLGEE